MKSVEENGIIVNNFCDLKRKNKETLPEKIWKRDDTLLVAFGASLCVRGLYFNAKSLGREDQFLGCMMTREDYIFGTVKEKFRKIAEEVKLRNRKNVILYLSCMDILTAADYEGLKNELESDGFNVLKLERGPLVKLRKNASLKLDGFFSENPEENGGIYGKSSELPPYIPSSVCLLNFVEEENDAVIINPGGCSNCIKRCEVTPEDVNIYGTEITHKNVIFGLDDDLSQGISDKFSREDAPLKLISTIVPKTISFDEEKVLNNLKNKNINARFVKSQVSQFGLSESSRFLDNLSKIDYKYKKSPFGKILLFGLSPLSFPSRADCKKAMNFFENSNDFSIFKSDGDEAIRAVMYFSIEAERGAKKIANDLDVSLYAGMPFGKSETKKFFKINQRDSDADYEESEIEFESAGVVSDFLNAIKIEQYIKNLNSEVEVKKYLYAPDKKIRDYYSSFPGGDGFIYFETGEELLKYSKNHEYWIGDLLFLNLFEKGGYKFLEFPFPAVSGRLFYDGADAMCFERFDEYFKNHWIKY